MVKINVSPSNALCDFICISSDSDMIYPQIVEDHNVYAIILDTYANTGRTNLMIKEKLTKKSITVPVQIVKGVKSVTVLTKELNISVGDTEQIYLDVTLLNGTHTNQFIGVSCWIANESIASVNGLGMVTGLKSGNTKVDIDYWTGTSYKKLSVPVQVTASKIATIPNGIQIIEDQAFYATNVERVIIPYGCEEIGSKAFAYCRNLRYIQIPTSVKKIAYDAFEGCNEDLVIEMKDE